MRFYSLSVKYALSKNRQGWLGSSYSQLTLTVFGSHIIGFCEDLREADANKIHFDVDFAVPQRFC